MGGAMCKPKNCQNQKKLMFEYFGVHGRAAPMRFILDYCGLWWEEKSMDMADWGNSKPAYIWGSLPVLHCEDGTKLYQSMAIFRYVGRKYKGAKGECLYPGACNPHQTVEQDKMLTLADNFKSQYVPIVYPGDPGYATRDARLKKFKEEQYPFFLKSMEDSMTRNNSKYLVCDNVTAADLCCFVHFGTLIFNQLSETGKANNFGAELCKYPKVEAWCKQMKCDCKCAIDK